MNGIEIYYEDVGEGFPLILLHGWPADHALWMFQTPVFSEYYRVITPDFRGLGKSTKPKGPITVEQMSDDIISLMDVLNLETAFVMGLSLGGVVAQQICLDHPSRVRASVWVGAPSYTETFMVKMTGREEPIIDVYLRFLESGGYPYFWNKVWKPNIDGFFNKSFYETPVGRDIINYLFEERYVRTNADPSSAIAITKGVLPWNVLHRLNEMKMPILIVAGDSDPTLKYCKEQHENCKSSEFYLVQNSGHICSMDHAIEFNKVTLDFLRKH